jgi:mRNA interferase MazF
LKRGDFVIAREPGTDMNKARPCLVVQADELMEVGVMVSVCPVTSTLRGNDLIRIPVNPDEGNGLKKASEIEIDRVQVVPKTRIAAVVGRASSSTLMKVDDALRRWLDL